MSTGAVVFDWLRTGVPLTLLADLASADGPDSAEIFSAEPADTSWVHPAAPGSP